MSKDRVAAINSSHKPPPPPVQNSGFRTAMEQSLSIIAARLGMSVTDLRTHMQFGKTPTDVAAERGMSQSALVGVIKESLSTSDIATGPKSADAIANRIANFKTPSQGAETQPEQAETTQDSDKDDVVAR